MPPSPSPSRNTWYTKVTAITGTIGSGKTSVIKMLHEKGALVVSADKLARKSVEKGSTGLNAIAQEFGPEILSESGELNRDKLAKIVFSDPAKRERLEQILHPVIADLAEVTFSRAIADGQQFLVYEVPLLFEAGMDKCGFKKIVVVTANEDTCLKRIMNRDGLSEEQAKARLAAQLPCEEKKKKADIVIDNSGSLEDLRHQIDAIEW